MGRKTKLTPEIQERLVQIIQAGNYRCVAARAVGIHPDTINQWMKKRRSPYTEFSEAVRRAEATSERVMVALIQQAAKTEWRAALEYLARKHPERWAKRPNESPSDQARQATTSSKGVLVVPGIMDPDEWQRLAEVYKSLQPTYEEPVEITDTLGNTLEAP